MTTLLDWFMQFMTKYEKKKKFILSTIRHPLDTHKHLNGMIVLGTRWFCFLLEYIDGKEVIQYSILGQFGSKLFNLNFNATKVALLFMI